MFIADTLTRASLPINSQEEDCLDEDITCRVN